MFHFRFLQLHTSVTLKTVYTKCLCTFLAVSLCVELVASHFNDKFAVHIEGGNNVADRIANSKGFRNLGQIGSLTDHYLFEHPHVHRRSANASLSHHKYLTLQPEVIWFEQQEIKSRKKRDLQTIPDLNFNDPLYSDMWYFHGGGFEGHDMNVQGAWKRGYTGKNVVISILDDGIERTHNDLKDNYNSLKKMRKILEGVKACCGNIRFSTTEKRQDHAIQWKSRGFSFLGYRRSRNDRLPSAWQINGEYYTNVYLLTPPKLQSRVQVTGASTVASEFFHIQLMHQIRPLLITTYFLSSKVKSTEKNI